MGGVEAEVLEIITTVPRAKCVVSLDTQPLFAIIGLIKSILLFKTKAMEMVHLKTETIPGHLRHS